MATTTVETFTLSHLHEPSSARLGPDNHNGTSISSSHARPHSTSSTPSLNVTVNGGDAMRTTDINSSPKPHKWVVLTAASGVIFVAVGFANTFGIFQDYYQSVLLPDVPPSQIILIGSSAASMYMILGAPAGRFADVAGYRASTSLGALLIVVSLFAASAATTFWQLFLAQGLMYGLGAAFVYYPAVTVTRHHFSSNRHGVVNGAVLSGGALGGTILPYCVSLMLEKYGLPTTFRALGAIAAGILLPATFVLRKGGEDEVRLRLVDRHRRRHDTQSQRTGSRTQARAPLLDLRLLRDKHFLLFTAASTVAMTGFLPRFFLVPSSALAAGVNGTYSAWLLGMMNGLSILGRLGIGFFADRKGKLTALICSFVLCGVVHLAFWLPGTLVSSPDAATALISVFVVGAGLLGSGFVSIIPLVLAQLFGGDDLASKFGLLNSIMGLAVWAGPSAVYAIVDAGGWSMGVMATGLVMILGGLGLLRAFRYPVRS